MSFLTQEFSQGVFTASAEATRAANRLPIQADFEYAKTAPEFKRRMHDVGGRLLRLSQRMCDQQANWLHVSAPKVVERAEHLTDVDDMFDGVIDVVDAMLERVDMCIDEARGVGNKQKLFARNNKIDQLDTHRLSGVSVPRPQLSFLTPVDNSNSPWIPLKYRQDPSGVQLTESGSYPHPHRNEIVSQIYPGRQMQVRVEQMFAPLGECPYEYVDTVVKLDALVQLLESVEEVAIDLEHHSLRSFQGFTCLMQLSTRTQDFIIDTLALRAEIHKLAPMFANPRILKVMHGADMDVVWLQRDFDIYVINLFDTGQAARLLEFPSFSLAHLLQHYCSLDVDKKHQQSDWRLRPLPDDMIEYARGDTHYLLYVHDRMTNQLIEKSSAVRNLLQNAYKNSELVCLHTWERDLWTPTAHLKLLERNSGNFTAQQLAVFAAVYEWRHAIAREEDESTRYVLPNYMLFNIAQAMPAEPLQLVGLCTPTPPCVRIYAHDICAVINKAKTEPAAYPKTPTRRVNPSESDVNTRDSGTGANEISNSTPATPATEQRQAQFVNRPTPASDANAATEIDIEPFAISPRDPIRFASLNAAQESFSNAIRSTAASLPSSATTTTTPSSSVAIAPPHVPRSFGFVCGLFPALQGDQDDACMAVAQQLKTSSMSVGAIQQHALHAQLHDTKQDSKPPEAEEDSNQILDAQQKSRNASEGEKDEDQTMAGANENSNEPDDADDKQADAGSDEDPVAISQAFSGVSKQSRRRKRQKSRSTLPSIEPATQPPAEDTEPPAKVARVTRSKFEFGTDVPENTAASISVLPPGVSSNGRGGKNRRGRGRGGGEGKSRAVTGVGAAAKMKSKTFSSGGQKGSKWSQK